MGGYEIFTQHDPFELMTPEEFDVSRLKLLAIDRHTGKVVAAEKLLPEDGNDPAKVLQRVKEKLQGLNIGDWYLLAGPPSKDAVPLE